MFDHQTDFRPGKALVCPVTTAWFPEIIHFAAFDAVQSIANKYSFYIFNLTTLNGE